MFLSVPFLLLPLKSLPSIPAFCTPVILLLFILARNHIILHFFCHQLVQTDSSRIWSLLLNFILYRGCTKWYSCRVLLLSVLLSLVGRTICKVKMLVILLKLNCAIKQILFFFKRLTNFCIFIVFCLNLSILFYVFYPDQESHRVKAP